LFEGKVAVLEFLHERIEFGEGSFEVLDGRVRH
jgi:hypothetical protein